MSLLLFQESHRQLMEQGFREVEPQRTDVIDKAALNSLLRVAPQLGSSFNVIG
jgi:hypothetical protein